MTAVTIPFKVLENGKTLTNHAAYMVKSGEEWKATTWGAFAGEVRAAARALIALGIQTGDAINILGFNRPEWTTIDVAAMAVGAVPAGIYTTNSPAECQYIIAHCEAPLVVLENENQWKKIEQIRGELPALRHVVMMKGTDIDDDMAMSWEEFIAKGAGVADSEVDARVEALSPDGLATLIYTSGTTGVPKGVMLSHDNLVWTASQALPLFGLNSSERTLSYLPLSHIAEQVFTIHAPAMSGWSVYFAESIERLVDNLEEVKPTVFFAVPRVWERFQAGVRAKLEEEHGAKAKIIDWARGVASRVQHLGFEGKKPSGGLALQYGLAQKLVFAKVKSALGLSEARVMATSAAPISPEVLEFFASLDLPVYEIYGQSEDTGPTSLNTVGATKVGSVGRPYPGSEVKIAADGEILAKGRHVFLGYYKDPRATAETLVDGWLHSGDLGEIDDDGFLWITGRKKDIIITAGGKNVAPKLIESGIKDHQLVSEVVVIGDRRKFLSAVITLDEEATAKFMADGGHDGEPHESEEVRAEIQKAVDSVNEHLARVEQIKVFAILDRQLSIEAGELTPTLKVKRNKVADHFSAEIDAMYGE
ncbi:MAG TPA: long-chain fatty acid--CoA ligase [Acidimicrobiia bacterium]